MASMKFFLVCVVTTLTFGEIYGRGKLVQPINRGSSWQHDFNMKVNPDDDKNYCGGLSALIRNGGKCGVCGDDYSLPRPRPHEHTGTYGASVIVRKYKPNRIILVQAILLENRGGYFRYSICPFSRTNELETEECFDKHPLKLLDNSDKYVLPNKDQGVFTTKLALPEKLTCTHCVLRWEYVANDTMGLCPDGTEKVGCGQQQIMRNCADVQIL